MREIGLTIIRMGMASTLMLMVRFMLVIGKMINKMERGKNVGRMGRNLLDRM